MSLLVGLPILTILSMVGYYPVTLTLMAVAIAVYAFLRFKRNDPRAGRTSWRVFAVLMGVWTLCIWIFVFPKGKL